MPFMYEALRRVGADEDERMLIALVSIVAWPWLGIFGTAFFFGDGVENWIRTTAERWFGP